MKKITRATFKSFVKKNNEKLFIKIKGKFDSQYDCINERANCDFKKTETTQKYLKNSLGVNGVWLVGGSDYFTHYEDKGFTGIEVDNCCGNFILAIKAA
jgi:hypothetical protein